jgi:hypothetical protein
LPPPMIAIVLSILIIYLKIQKDSARGENTRSGERRISNNQCSIFSLNAQ